MLVLLLLVLGGVVGTAPAKAKKDALLSKLFCQAQYVYVEAYEGDALNPNVAPEDRGAVDAVEQRIERWGRYTLVYEPRQADLVWVVWKERKGGNRLPGQPSGVPPMNMPQPNDPGSGPGQNPGGPGQPGAPGGPRQNPGGVGGPDGVGISNGGPGVGAVWPVNDQLAVYMPQNDESLESPIWKKSEKDGLEPPMHLFAELADAVDDACSNSGSKH
jgi:hypothetical protein